LDYSSGQSKPKSWKQIWGAGQGIGVIEKSQAAADFIDQLRAEYQQAFEQMSRK
jgi:nitronate monooxygenase